MNLKPSFRLIILLICLIPSLSWAQQYRKHTPFKNRLEIELSSGVLSLIPLSAKAIKVEWQIGNSKEEQELVIIKQSLSPTFKVTETTGTISLATAAVTVIFDKSTTMLQFKNADGKTFLAEQPGSRKLIPSSVNNEPCFIAEQSFKSPKDEYLFGLGQFQDGNYNLRNVSRILKQVNTQIAIPFIYSNKGYGLLWNQYGLSHFNPADSIIVLEKTKKPSGGENAVETTTSAGTQRISQQQASYEGDFTLKKAGYISMMLDLGGMENRHLLIIDGVPHIDQSNLWLPPAVGKIIHLDAGKHHVQVVCKLENSPKLSWKPVADETTFRSPNAKSLSYIVFSGKDADEVIANYRNVSGTVPMLPLWAFGFWQCRERYTSSKHLVETVKQFRDRKLPMDVIVQDWQYWGKYGWGVPKFDEANYPDPSGFINELHTLNARFSISVWENIDKKSDIAKAYLSQNLYIPNSPWIDIYNPKAQDLHWKTLQNNLFVHGVDSWWMDATEPENDALTGKQTYFGLGDFYRLTYPLLVSKAIYEGQRKSNPNKRVVILTRSAFAGQQRFGTINWSGDIGWNWDAFRRQVVAGLNFSLTGMPYWTTDIGGFFRPGASQYTDPKYHDILNRWFQWGVFTPIFRMHGYQSETEPWKYGPEMEANMRKMLNLRYQLLPYIYSEGWQVSKHSSTMMRPMVMDFNADTVAIQQPYQYMFGKSILVAPVLKADVTTWNVYLPKATTWYNFWSGERFVGGKMVATPAPKDQIPLYVRAGSIIPLGKPMQYTGEKKQDTLELRVYPGADGSFTLYEDEGDNYTYEQGKYGTILFKWTESSRKLKISSPQGSYPGQLQKRIFNVVIVGKQRSKQISYNGKVIEVNLY